MPSNPIKIQLTNSHHAMGSEIHSLPCSRTPILNFPNPDPCAVISHYQHDQNCLGNSQHFKVANAKGHGPIRQILDVLLWKLIDQQWNCCWSSNGLYFSFVQHSRIQNEIIVVKRVKNAGEKLPGCSFRPSQPLPPLEIYMLVIMISTL